MEVKQIHPVLPPLELEEGFGGFTIAFFGSSRSGKTTLMMSLYKKLYDRRGIIATLFSVNSQIPLYDGCKYLLRSSQFGDEESRYIRAQKYINLKTDNKYRFMYLLDDFIDVRHSKILNNLVLTYRNSNLSTLVCLQYVRLLSKQARSNINNVICFSSNSQEARKEIIDIYLSSPFRALHIPKTEWDAYYITCTQNHNYLYLHVATGNLWSSLNREYLLKY